MENFDDKYKKKNPFSVPDGYFDHLTDNVIERIKEDKKPRRTGVVYMLKPYIGLAAIFLLALFVVQIVLPRFIDNSRMLKKESAEVVQEANDRKEDVELDSSFNPTSEEILEYLSTEVNSYDLIYAELY